MPTVVDSTDLFRHVTADKASLYRSIMDIFAAAKRQYRLQLRPDEILSEIGAQGAALRIEEVNAALAQLAERGEFARPDYLRTIRES